MALGPYACSEVKGGGTVRGRSTRRGSSSGGPGSGVGAGRGGLRRPLGRRGVAGARGRGFRRFVVGRHPPPHAAWTGGPGLGVLSLLGTFPENW